MPSNRRLLSAGLLIATLAACGPAAPTPTAGFQPTVTAAPTQAAAAATAPPAATGAPTAIPAAASPPPLPTLAPAVDPNGPTATPPFPERQITAETIGQIRLLRTVGFGRARAAALAPDQQRLAVATSAGLAFFSYPALQHLRFDRIPGGAEQVAWGAEGVTVDVTVNPPGGASMIETRDANTGMVFETRAPEIKEPQYPITIVSPDGGTQARFNVPDASPTPGVRISRAGQQIYADNDTEQLAFSRDGALAAMVTYGGLVRVRDLAAGTDNELALPGFWGAAFSADGQFLITSERQLTVWDVVSGEQRSSAPIAAAQEPWIINAAQRIRHLPDGSALLLDGDYSFFEGSRRVGDLWSAGPAPQPSASAPIASLGIANYETYAGAVSPAGAGAATTDGATLDFYDAAGNIADSVAVPEQITALEYAPDGALLAIATQPGAIKLLGADRKPAGGFASDQPIELLRFSGDGALLAGLGRDGALRIWRRGAEPPASGDPALTIPGAVGPVGTAGDPGTSLIFTADGGLLGLADGDGVRFYRLSDGALAHRLPGPAASVDIGPRQRAIAVLRDGYVELWGLQ